jgi:2-hydroxy-3-keto-5-methylthiopentenyl-1-phosphate phosphatase
MKLLANMRLKKEDYGMMVLESRLLFRHGITELLTMSHDLNLPFYIVSGGITEIIEACFSAIFHNGEAPEHLRTFWSEKVHVLSNSFEYSEDNITKDYARPILHIMNKQKFIYELHRRE